VFLKAKGLLPTSCLRSARSECVRVLPASSSLVLFSLVAASLPLPSAAYEVAAVPDGGTVKGKVVYRGPAAMKRIVPTKDRDTCGAIREEPEVAVGPGQGVLDAVVYLRKVARGKAWAKPAKAPELVNDGCIFVPHVQALPVGTTLAIVNADPVMHNTHSFQGKATVFNIALPTAGIRVERPLKKEGMVRVECDAHGWMLGWIYVADSPYYAVTGKDGAFAIPEVPPGSYALVAWHEYTGEVEVPVVVKAREPVQVTIEIKKK
jgi:plastocyanin